MKGALSSPPRVCSPKSLITLTLLVPSLTLAIFLDPSFSPTGPHSGELRTQKLKSHLARTQSLNVFPLKPGVGQYIAIHATLIAR